MNNQKIVKQYGDCEVHISFKESSSNIKDKVLWLLLECYHDRIDGETETEKLTVSEVNKVS